MQLNPSRWIITPWRRRCWLPGTVLVCVRTIYSIVVVVAVIIIVVVIATVIMVIVVVAVVSKIEEKGSIYSI